MRAACHYACPHVLVWRGRGPERTGQAADVGGCGHGRDAAEDVVGRRGAAREGSAPLPARAPAPARSQEGAVPVLVRLLPLGFHVQGLGQAVSARLWWPPVMCSHDALQVRSLRSHPGILQTTVYMLFHRELIES